jgi:hypothetical protein
MLRKERKKINKVVKKST